MPEMTERIVSFLNSVAVGLFGIILSASFCGALQKRRDRILLLACMVIMALLHGVVLTNVSDDAAAKLYPLIVHLPTVLVLFFIGRRLLWSVISVLCAYLFCEIRRWFGLLAVLALNGNDFTLDLAELIITIPLLFFLIRFASPAICQLMDYPLKTRIQFGIIPAIYYIFDYLTRIYTDLLSGGYSVVLEFMPFVCCVAYLIFLLHNFEEERKRQHLLQVQSDLDLQLSQAVREIEQLRKSQEQTARYRHDLRHHLQYLLTCIENGCDDRARSYIADINKELESQRVFRCCENETANLILSALAGQAERAGIKMEVQGAVPSDVGISDSDLCVLLSNSVENAIHACQPIAEAGEECIISVRFSSSETTRRFFLQVINPYKGKIRFEKGIPVSQRPGHGIGVHSICAIVEHYGGCCNFSAENGQFILRLSV